MVIFPFTPEVLARLREHASDPPTPWTTSDVIGGALLFFFILFGALAGSARRKR